MYPEHHYLIDASQENLEKNYTTMPEEKFWDNLKELKMQQSRITHLQNSKQSEEIQQRDKNRSDKNINKQLKFSLLVNPTDTQKKIASITSLQTQETETLQDNTSNNHNLTSTSSQEKSNGRSKYCACK